MHIVTYLYLIFNLLVSPVNYESKWSRFDPVSNTNLKGIQVPHEPVKLIWYIQNNAVI